MTKWIYFDSLQIKLLLATCHIHIRV